jgi:hypothetical protein
VVGGRIRRKFFYEKDKDGDAPYASGSRGVANPLKDFARLPGGTPRRPMLLEDQLALCFARVVSPSPGYLVRESGGLACCPRRLSSQRSSSSLTFGSLYGTMHGNKKFQSFEVGP